LAWISISIGDRVSDNVGGPRKRKSVSRIETAISSNAGIRIKIVADQGIILALRVTR
jgi:hypothetical protein